MLHDCGCVLIGRGMGRIYCIAEDIYQSLECTGFDDAMGHLPDVMRQALHTFALEMLEYKVPTDVSLDALLEYFRNKDDRSWMALSVDAFLLGYSDINKSMGIATTWSYKDFQLDTIYKDDFFYFLKKEPLKGFGRKPQSIDDMVDCFRRVYQYEKKQNKNKNILIGGGDIDLTTVYPDKSITTDRLGPVDQPHLSLVPTGNPVQSSTSAKVGRNDPCPCGSGKKYKKCCGQ